MEKSDAAADNPPAVLVTPDLDASCPFEGPEKLLEIWFHPAPLSADPQSGLRAIDRHDWENMLSVVKCKVLSMISGHEMDAYLLSESSFFVFPHKVILKTCGTTLNLLGLPRILEIAADGCGYRDVWRCFYSRKSFMFPERQHGPHREWKDEMDYLDNLFPKHNGAAYAVGKVNGDHWLLYLTTPPGDDQFSNPDEPYNLHTSSIESSQTLASPNENDPVMVSVDLDQDYTIELLMTKLAAPARRPFFFLDEDLKDFTPEQDSEGFTGVAQAKGAFVSSQLGISSIFPQHLTKLDSYAFEPCGYSANGIVSYGEETSNVGLATNGEGYYTIHVTPEEGWSYASFECNVPIMPADFHSPTAKNLAKDTKGNFPNLETLIQRVVDIFQPGTLTLTLFISSPSPTPTSSPSLPIYGLPIENPGKKYPLGIPEIQHHIDDEAPPFVETAQKVFRRALLPRGYKRTDKINYEFGGYDLAFATFQKL